MTDLNAIRSTDAMLADGLEAVEGWEGAERGSDAEFQAAEQATRCLAELDAAMRDGGRLPLSWMPRPSLPPQHEQGYRCGLCGRDFATEAEADEHLDLDHPGEHGHTR